jgi:hypothetical protein
LFYEISKTTNSEINEKNKFKQFKIWPSNNDPVIQPTERRIFFISRGPRTLDGI